MGDLGNPHYNTAQEPEDNEPETIGTLAHPGFPLREIAPNEDTLQSRANLLATRLRKLAANLEDEAATDSPEGCTILESVLGVRSLAEEFIEWYLDEDPAAGEQPTQPTQGSILPDGSLLAVIVSPEDLQEVFRDNYDKAATIEQCKEILNEEAQAISDAMVDGWYETLANFSALEFAAEDLPPIDQTA